MDMMYPCGADDYHTMSNDYAQQAAALFGKHARLYDEKYHDVSHYHDALDVFCQALPEHEPHVLELACGPGNITRYLLQQRQDMRLLGIDLAPEMIALAAAHHPSAAFRVMDCRSIGSLPDLYDGIMCSFCLPYLNKAESVQLVADAARRLKKGGVIYVSTMEDLHHKSGIQRSSQGDELMVYYHEAGYLEAAFHRSGLEIISSLHQDFRPGDGSVMTDLILIARRL